MLRICSGFAEDQNFRVIPGAVVTAVDAVTLVAPAMFTDRAGTVPITSQSVITDVYGRYAFYVADGVYRLTATKSGVSSVLPDVFVGRGDVSPAINEFLDADTPEEILAGLNLGTAAAADVDDFAPFAAPAVINRRLKKDDLVRFVDGLGDDWSLAPDALERYVQSIPHGLVGNGTNNDTSAYMDLYNLVLQEALTESPSASGRILLPPNPLLGAVAGRKESGAYMLDAYSHHPAISVQALARGSVRIQQRPGQSPIGGVRAFVRVLARCKGIGSSDAWDFKFENVLVHGNRTAQTASVGWIFYVEPASDDPDYAYWSTLPGGANVKGYAGGTFENCEIIQGLGGVFCGGNRQRMRFTSRSLNHGIYDADAGTITVEGVCLRILGNDPELIGFALGGGTGTSLSVGGCSGVTVEQPNIWNPQPECLSDTRVAVLFTNVNGASINGGNVNGQILIDGGGGNGPWRGIDITGVSLRPLNEQFAANGVMTGAVSDSHNAHVVVKGGHRSVNVRSSFLASTPDGWSYKYCVAALEGSQVRMDLLDNDTQPGKSYAVAPFYEDGSGAKVWADIPNGTTGERLMSGFLKFPGGTEAYNSPIQGQRTLIMGASREMRQVKSLGIEAANVTLAAGVLTVTSSVAHELLSGARVLVGSQADNTSNPPFDDYCLGWGEATRVNANTITVPQFVIPNAPTSGTNTSKFWVVIQAQFTHQSPWTYCNSRINGAKVYVANLSLGSTNTLDCEGNTFPLAQSMVNDFDHIEGTFSLGNVVLNALNDGLTIAQMMANGIPPLTRMLDWFTQRGKTVSIQGFVTPANNDNTGASVAYGLALENAVVALIESRYRGKVNFLPLQSFTIIPGSGAGDPLTSNAGDVHANAAGAQMVGLLQAEEFLSQRPIPRASRLIVSPLDRRSQSAFSNQLMECGWSASGKSASSLAANFSGTVWQECEQGNLTPGSSAASAAFVILPREDGFGYDLAWRITSTGGGNTFNISITGDDAVALLSSLVVPGRQYESWFHYSIDPSTPTVMRDYNLWIAADVGAASGKLAAARTNVGLSVDPNAPNPIEDIVQIPRHRIPAGLTTYALQFNVRLAPGEVGTIDCRIGRISLREVS